MNKWLTYLKHSFAGRVWDAGWDLQRVYCKCGASRPLKPCLKEVWSRVCKMEGR